MKFVSIQIENFLVLTEAKINLADRGLVLIQGINSADSSANSNGAGKSSIADALCWALYGVTARGESGDQIVNNKAGKNTRVEIILNDDGIQYRIVRHRKHKTGKNNVHVFMDDGLSGEKDLTKGTDKLTQETIEKIIGASLDVFTGSIYAGQEKMPDLPSMTDKMLKVLIEEAAGINALEAAYVKARDNAKIAKSDLDMSEAELQHLQAAEAGLVSQRQQALDGDSRWKQQRDEQMQNLTDRVRNQLIPEAQKLAAEAPKAEIDRLTAEIAAIDQKIASVGQEQAELARQAHNVSITQRASYAAATDLVNAQAALDRAKKELTALEHGGDCDCTSCGQPMPADVIAEAKQRAKDRVDAADALVTAKMTAADIAENAAKAAEGAHDAFKLGMTDVSKEVAQRSSLAAQQASLVNKDRQRQQLVATAKADMDTITRLKGETPPFEQMVADIQNRIDANRQQITNKSGEVAVKRQRFELEQEVVKVFAPSGVRARVLDEVTPYLNGQTAKYLSILSDGNINAEWSTLTVNKSGEMKEKFAIDVSSAISSKTFKGLSGGEKRKVRVATALALQDLVSTRAAKPIDLFVGDEIDDALDASGLERLMIILDEKAKERGTVMVISHNSLRDEIPNVLNVERTASGETKISETTS